jgi:hypothetical protein
MEHNNKINELHRQSLENVEAFIKTKGLLPDTDKEKVDKAKAEWLEAWNKFQEVLLYLERIEI